MKTIFLVILLICSNIVLAGKSGGQTDGDENASNPLAAVSNTDLRWKYFDLGHGDRLDYYIDGSTMLSPKLKLKYQLHYWDTDVTGRDENDWESASLKLIYFAKEGKLGGKRPYRLAVGLEWIKDLGDLHKGIGSGADQISPFVGIAIGVRPGVMLIPLVQHFTSYRGEDVSKTSARLIGILKLPNKAWAKLDLKVPYDWENETVPASFELQLGKTFSSSLGAYIDLQKGIGGDKPNDWATGIGIRFAY